LRDFRLQKLFDALGVLLETLHTEGRRHPRQGPEHVDRNGHRAGASVGQDRAPQAALEPSAQESSAPAPSAKVALASAGKTAEAGRGSAAYIAPDWQPGDEWLSLCRQHGVPDAFARELVPGFVMYWRDRAQSRFSWGNAFYKHVLREWRQEQTRRGAAELETTMSAQWQPSQDAVEILCNAGINEAFIEDAVPEFVLYWRERGAQNGTWNTRFIEHIRRQWARYKVSVVNDGVPRPISENWQPSAEVFDVLRLAEIDEDFARSKVPEFVLYWRDTGQPQASWNTRFLQFIKYSWARRLDAGAATGLTHARDKQSAESGGKGLEATFRRFTDRSWAE
ncbi:MAG: DnaT-like ssDNA-binding domain-containing protein, partial [Pseudohongiella sp.]